MVQLLLQFPVLHQRGADGSHAAKQCMCWSSMQRSAKGLPLALPPDGSGAMILVHLLNAYAAHLTRGRLLHSQRPQQPLLGRGWPRQGCSAGRLPCAGVHCAQEP